MNVIYKEGSIYCPGFDAAGNRNPDLDVLIALGSLRDPRHQRVREMKVTIPVPASHGVVTSEDITEARVPRYEFHFHGRPYEGRDDVLCVVISNHDGAEPFAKTERFAEIAYAACQYYARNV